MSIFSVAHYAFMQENARSFRWIGLILVMDDECIEAYIGIAETFVELDEIDNAIENLQIGFDKTGNEKIEEKLNSLSISEYLQTAQKYFSERNFESAKNEYEKVIALDDKFVDAYMGAADSYVGLGSYRIFAEWL